MKKKNYEVSIEGWSVVTVIGAESEEEARELALTEISSSDFEIDNIKTEELKTEDDVESSKRHANAVSEDN